MALDELAELFAVFVLHVDELDAVAVRTDIPDDRGEMNLAKTGANFQFDGIADVELLGRFKIGAAEADCFYAGKSCRTLLNLGTQRRFERDAGVTAGNDEICAGLRSGFEGGARSS